MKPKSLLLRALALVAVLTLATLTSTVARADSKRQPQDYGSPQAHETTAEEVLLWPPRVVLFPLWLTSEFLIRRPLGALVTVAEREQWPNEVVEFFTFGERRQFTIFPSALFDFGLLPSVGFNAKWKYLLADPNTARLHFGTWGPKWIALKLVDTYDLSPSESVSLDLRFFRRQDNRFYGVGPNSQGDVRYRYGTEQLEGSAVYRQIPWRSSSFETRAGVRSLSINDGSCCADPDLGQGIRDGVVPAPPGFGTRFVGGFQRMEVTLDSRRPRPEQGSGFRAELREESVYAPDRKDPRAWVRYGAEAGAFLDMTGNQRVVSLSAAVEFADPLVGDVPFPEQATLGGDKPMRGYLRDRLIGRSSAVGRLQYTWPIWVYLDGVIEVDVGNVFGPHLEGFDPKLLRLTSGIGLRGNGERDSGFEFLLAGGTDPFDNGFNVSSFRLLIGSHHGF